MKASILYKLTIDRMENTRWVKKVHLVANRGRKWLRTFKRLAKKCELTINVLNNGLRMEN